MTGHMPLPWHATESWDGSWAVWLSLDENKYGVGLIATTNTESNARLIAAAPEMLAALEDARALIEDASGEFYDAQGLLPMTIAGIERDEWQRTLDSVLVAIQKAHGEQVRS